MLVLTRKIGETICVGEDIQITVVNIQGGNVRLGVTAPKEVIVDREDIHAKREILTDEQDDETICQPVG